MQIRDKGLAACAAAGFGLWVAISLPAFAETNTTAKKSSDAPIELAKFSKHKTYASTKSKSQTAANTKHSAKIADAAKRGKSATSDNALAKLASTPSVANARAELTVGNPLTTADDEARNLAATDDNEIVTMNGVQIASADQLNDMDRAVADDKAEIKSEETAVAAPVSVPSSGRVMKAMPSSERHLTRSDDIHPWSNTSLIGKIFVAFGSLLTLASAARLIIA